MLDDLATLEIAPRADRVRGGFAAAGIDALVVTRLPNVRYLTGFSGSAGIVVLTPSEMEERRVGKECRSRWSPYH